MKFSNKEIKYIIKNIDDVEKDFKLDNDMLELRQDLERIKNCFIVDIQGNTLARVIGFLGLNIQALESMTLEDVAEIMNHDEIYIDMYRRYLRRRG